MSKIAFVLGTRPEIIKSYSSIQYCRNNNIPHVVISTDQHYDENMRDVFFEELGLEQPAYNLGIGSGSHSIMLANMLIKLEEAYKEEKPSVIVVQGDTNTVLAGCLAAIKMDDIKVAHIEAGLRSYDRTMPEEYNRLIVDHCSDFLFAPTEKQRVILLGEGIAPESVFVTGNPIVDAVYDITRQYRDKPDKKPYALLTMHRPSNTDNQENLHCILTAIQKICQQENFDCIFPMHPRLKSKRSFILKFDRIKIVEPLEYSSLLRHIKKAEIVFTDSGGIQEESCILKKKCLILRTNTERPETLDVGGAVILDSIDTNNILTKYKSLKNKSVEWWNPFGDGKAGERIVDILVNSI